MNTTIKLAVAGALSLGAIAAHADIALPATDSSTVLVFAEVLTSGGTVLASYAANTGVSVTSAFNGVNATYAGDANLAALFAADGTGDTLVWAVQGGQYTGLNTTGVQKAAGSTNIVSTLTNPSQVASKNTGNLVAMNTGLTNFVPNLNTNIDNNGNGTSVEGASAATAGIWDLNTTSGASAWFGQSLVTPITGTGTVALYSITGGGTATTGSATTKIPLLTNGTVTFSAAGVTFATNSSPPPVPLPPAVWLLGSGLLGLAGVARRKAAKA
jgi:hypothetical protein